MREEKREKEGVGSELYSPGGGVVDGRRVERSSGIGRLPCRTDGVCLPSVAAPSAGGEEGKKRSGKKRKGMRRALTCGASDVGREGKRKRLRAVWAHGVGRCGPHDDATGARAEGRCGRKE